MREPKKIFRIVMCSLVILFGFLVMIIPIVKSISIYEASSFSISEALSFVFLCVLLGILSLPSVLYCIVTMKKKEMEYGIIPAVFIVVTEYYFFHDYSTWITSDPNAAIGLIIAPFYLRLILGFSYGVAFVVLKICNQLIR
jgi:hypothetical protein